MCVYQVDSRLIVVDYGLRNIAIQFLTMVQYYIESRYNVVAHLYAINRIVALIYQLRTHTHCLSNISTDTTVLFTACYNYRDRSRC